MTRAPAAAVPSIAEQEALASVRSLRRLVALCIVVPVVLAALFAWYRYEQVFKEAELRIDRAQRIAREHALKVLEINETMLRYIVDLAGDGDGDEPGKLHRQLE